MRYRKKIIRFFDPKKVKTTAFAVPHSAKRIAAT